MATGRIHILVLALLALAALAPAAHAQRRGGSSGGNRGGKQGANEPSFAPQASPGFRPGERRSLGPQNDPGFNPGERRTFNHQFDPGFRPGSDSGRRGRPDTSDSFPGSRPEPRPSSIQNFQDPGVRPGPGSGEGGGTAQQRSLQDPGFGNRRPEGGFSNNFGNRFDRPPFNPIVQPSGPGSRQGLVESFPTPNTNPQPPSVSPQAPAQAPPPKPLLQLDPNPVQLAVRAASPSDLRSAGEFCGVQVQKQIFTLGRLLGEEILDPSRLLTELAGKGVPDPAREQIFDAIRHGDATLAEQRFLQATSDPSRAAELARQVETKTALTKICEAALANSVSDTELRAFADSLNGARVAGVKQTRARQTMGDLLDYLTIRGAIARAAEQPAKTPGGAASAVAPSIVCPGLPLGTVAAMGDGVLLVGTGGAGKMEARRTSLADALGVPLATGGAAPDAPAEAPRGIVLQCPAQHDVSVQYSLKAKSWEQPYVMAPGQWQAVDEDQLEIDFNKGGAFGRQRYALTPGTYRFEATAAGWELRSHKQQVVIDNSRSPQPFHYVLGETKHTVAPGKTAMHQSDYPLIARYLRSAASSAEKKAFLETGRYQVALSGLDSQWDLFVAQ